MIDPQGLLDSFIRLGIVQYSGVPDSVLGSFCARLAESSAIEHVTCVNEGSAIGIAMGWQLSTRKTPLVYMQSSGLANALNPLMSLADSSVYSVPMVLLIGVRGQDGRDEPQHTRTGAAIPVLLDAAGIPWKELGNQDDVDSHTSWAIDTATQTNAPIALLVPRGAFPPGNWRLASDPGLTRATAIDALLEVVPDTDIVVGSTGYNARELFTQAASTGKKQRMFLTVGGMGHSTSIGLGLSIGRPGALVWVVEGDGGLLMHLGSLVTCAALHQPNLRIIILNNGIHESVGGQPTYVEAIKLSSFANALQGFTYFRAEDAQALRTSLQAMREIKGPCFLEVMTVPDSSPTPPRPTLDLRELAKELSETNQAEVR